jgi:hypothetical protein
VGEVTELEVLLQRRLAWDSLITAILLNQLPEGRDWDSAFKVQMELNLWELAAPFEEGGRLR